MPSSGPRAFAAVGNTLFFSANDGIHGQELWKSDGTEAGTVLVKNIKPNDDGPGPGSRPSSLTAVGDRLFFTAGDGVHGRELWKSDGSRAGTVLVKNIKNDSVRGPGSSPAELTAMGSGFFFTADDGTHGRELWKSDGSRAGTVLVKNISPRFAENYYGSPHYLTARGNRVFFSANDGTHGVELWRSNGSRTGTVMVKNIDTNERNDAPDYPGAMPSQLTAMGGRLYFVAGDETRGEELWKSDGSRVGTVLVKDIDQRRRQGSLPSQLTRLDDVLFFAADDGVRGDELWKSDGSRMGTVLVKNIDPNDGSGYLSGSQPTFLTPAGDQLFFIADDGTSGEGLWKSNGSRAGTILVKNLDFRGDGFASSPMEASQDRVFFTAVDGTPGLGLWTSDGSTSGTVLVQDFDSCDDSYYPKQGRPSYLTAVGSLLFFAAEDADHGEELWKSDGSTEGTGLVKDIRTGTTP